MRIENLAPKPTSRVLFNRSSFKSVPKASGCYVITTFQEDILYIGLAKNINNRFDQHLNNPEKTRSTLLGKGVWFYYMIYDIKNLEKLERTWLNLFLNEKGNLPILNKISSPLI